MRLIESIETQSKLSDQAISPQSPERAISYSFDDLLLEEESPSIKTTSQFQTALNIAKTIIGGGLFAVPFVSLVNPGFISNWIHLWFTINSYTRLSILL